MFNWRTGDTIRCVVLIGPTLAIAFFIGFIFIVRGC